MRNLWKRKFTSLALLAILFGVNVGLLVTPNTAYAQAPDVVAADAARDVVKTILGLLKDALGAGLLTGLMNVLVDQLNTFAYESAVWVASGGNAEDPLFDPRPVEDYLRDAGAQIASDLLDELSGLSVGDIASKYGVTLPDDPNLMAAIQNGVQSAFVPSVNHEDFDFNEIKDNWQGYLVDVTSDTQATAQEKTEAILTTLAKSFDPGANELSSSMAVYGQVINEAQVKAQIQSDQFQKNDGFLALTDAAGEYTETPASFVKEKIHSAIKKSEDGASEIGVALLSNSEGLIQIGASAASLFTSTLVSELMNQVSKGLFADIATDFESVNPFDSNAVVASSRERAQERLKSLSTFKPITVTDFSLLSEFSTCPANFRGVNRRLYNCVLDTSFTSAISQSESGAPVTLSEAIEDGYIDGNWPLIPSGDTARNQDQKCYTYGFCHSNLVKMRKARIIPIGWELAAESPNNSTSSPVTLQEVMDNFNSCNGDGELDTEFPWCHLVDPNWVIKYPETSCRTMAYGQLIQASGTDARSTECVDPQTCIAEDENGNCTGGWGYCVREQNTWNFRGDSCPEQYASCVSFTTEAGEAVDYLTSTVDYAGCNADNAGCQWYATAKRLIDDVWHWPRVNNEELAQVSDSAQEYRIYLNSNVETCDAADAGCTQLVVRDTDTRLNLVTNPSFEGDADGNSWPDSWVAATSFAAINYSDDNTIDRSGSAAVDPETDIIYQGGITIGQSRFYTFSFYAAQITAGQTVTAVVSLADETGEDPIDLTGYSYTGDCTQSDNDLDGTGYKEALVISATPTSTSYERFECIFTAPSLSDANKVMIALVGLSGGVYVDDVQLEQGEDASMFRDGYGESLLSNLTLAYAKMPPAYLGCTGASTDPAECDDYATMCTELDVGCELYIPSNGDPNVTGVISDLDSCPSSCVGYETYKQEPTLYEPNGSFPEYFIPDTATECSAEAVGCDEFTNLTTEEKEYYTYLRACVTSTQAASNSNSDQEAVFYTWEGSDVSGFQLKTWHLLESDMSTSPDSAAPCTNWVTTTAGISCDDDSNGDSAVDSATTDCDSHEDIFTEPDCREFYDADGTVHFRFWTDTVTVEDACVSYRKTEIAGDAVADKEANCTDSGGLFETDINTCLYFGWTEESTTCSAAVNGCREYTGGRSANSRQVYEELYEDDGLVMFEAANATSTTLSNESIATEGHSLLTTQNVWTYLYESSACTTSGGCASSTGKLGATCAVSYGDTSCGTLENQLQTDKTYTLSFWAKGSGTIDVGFDIDADSTPEVDTSTSTSDAVFETDLSLSGEWQEYQVGPLNMTSADFPTFGDGTVLVFSPDTSSTLYLDNVVLREGEQDITLIKNSWVTPAICDMDINGNISDQYYLGCSEYLMTDGTAVNLRSFSKLCDEDKVGCTGYFETANSDSETAAMYNAVCENVDSDGSGTDQAVANTACNLFTNSTGTAFDTASPELCTIRTGETSCQFDADYLLSQVTIDSDTRLTHIVLAADTVVIPADHDLFAIVGSEDECDSSSASCTEVGQVTFTTDRSAVDSYVSAYLMNDPDSYTDILCDRDEQYCQAFDGGSAGTYYFKDPTAQTCEYKTSVTVGSSTFDGWFRTGTSEFCYGTGSCSNDSAVTCSTNSDCRVGTCSNDSSACYSGFDCDTGASCSVADEEATCLIDDGTYLVGGDYSSVWVNGDLEFDNWTATCSAEFNGCSEFQDLLDIADDEFYSETDGQSYFFLNNDNLDENTLITSQQCSGQVSNKLGCVLFNDTGLPGLDYNASATYIASVHADDLFGDSSFDLVDPIDCDSDDSTITKPDGTTVDLCAQRCAYDHGDLYVSDLGGDAGGKRSEERRLNDPYIYEMDDIYVFGTSCYEDADCPDMVGDTGDTVPGTCEIEVQTSPDETVYYDSNDDGVQDTLLTIDISEDVPALENDANRILKVNRDRQCSEWLTCSSSQTVWDESISQYKTICDGIDLCTEYSALGDSSFCSSWNPDDPTVILDSARYAERDISWYGSEFSGYAVPDSFPIQRLSQVNIAASGTCEDDSSVCDIDTDCDVTGSVACVAANEKDFRLAYDAGECSDGYGQDCVVGYCANTAAPCSASSDCEPDGGECIVGACLEVSATTCTDDSECTGDDETCMSGLCTADVGDCDLNYACLDSSGDVLADAVCFPSVAVKTGSCYRDRCIVAANGDQFSDETAETQVCRAWPESNSPFPTVVVSEWTKLDDILTTTEMFEKTSSVTDFSMPYLASTRFSGFDRANVCLPGEDCDCNYKKLSNGLGNSVYIDDESDAETIAGTLSASASTRLGICSAGTGMGAICTTDEDCGTDDSGGKCDSITKEDQIIGLQGYCLERDTGISILGQADLGACLTWFPVDQLTGSTDLNAKYKGAGYFEDTYACNSVTGYVDLENTSVACAEMDTHDCQSDDPDDVINRCMNEVNCPDDYFAIMGQCLSTSNYNDNSAGGGTYAYSCSEPLMTGTLANADCPFMCIPIGSRHTDGTVCSPAGYDGSGNSDDGTPVYIYTGNDGGSENGEIGEKFPETEDLEVFGGSHGGDETGAVGEFADCALKGVELTDTNFHENFVQDCWNSGEGGSNDVDPGCYGLDVYHNGYVGCKEVTQVATSDESYAWTDRMKGDLSTGGEITTFTIDGDVEGVGYPEMEYQFSTGPGPYGLNTGSSYQPEDRTETLPPFRIGQCFKEPYGIAQVYYNNPEESNSDGLFDECPTDYAVGVDSSGVTGADPSVPEDLDYRSFINFNLLTGTTTWSPSTDSYSAVWNRLNQLFALPTIGKLYEWGKNEDGLGTSSGETLDYVQDQNADDKYSDATYDTDSRDEGNPPIIYPLDVDNCFGQYCREGDANTGITVNDSNEGNQAGNGGFFRGTVKFYAAADKNQLPLRRVIVDWGDDYMSGSDDTDNFYKNHRGILPDSQTQTYCDVCDSTTDVSCEWGMTADSCDPNYFSYQHNYRCSDSDLVTMAACVLDDGGLITNSPCSDGDACYYRPSVHVRDNWGWCSGTCTYASGVGDNTGAGCYDGDGTLDESSTFAPIDECNYNYYPDSNGTATISTVVPWVYYDGQIVVTP